VQQLATLMCWHELDHIVHDSEQNIVSV